MPLLEDAGPRDKISLTASGDDPLFRLVDIFFFPSSHHWLVSVDVRVPDC